MSAGEVARRVGALALVLGSIVLGGCPDPEPADPCGNEDGDPVLTLTNRDGGPELTDGAEVEIFLPPQGGVFTELDVTIDGLAHDDLENLHVVFEDRDTAESLADVRYVGHLVPLLCIEETDVLVVARMPVGFTDPVVLEDLDGVAATVTGTLETARGDFGVTHEVVLRAVDY